MTQPVLRIGAWCRDALEAARKAGFALTLPTPDPRTLIVTGASGAGSTTVARAILGLSTDDLPEWAHAPGVPVEYVAGDASHVLVGTTASADGPLEWSRPGAVPTSEVRRIRVISTASLLGAANLRVVDHPGGWLPVMEPGVVPVVIYVVTGRGVTEHDEHALERLRPYRTAIVQNIRDGELHPARSKVTVTPAHDTAPGLVIPVVPTVVDPSGRHLCGPAERAALERIVALLISDAHTTTRLEALAGAADQAREKLRRRQANRLAAVRRGARMPDSVAVLGAVAQLTAIVADRETAVAADTALTRLHSLPGLVSNASARGLSLLREAVDELLVEYELRAASRTTRSAGAGWDHGSGFGARHVKVRRELFGFLQNILDAGETLRLTAGERNSIAGLSQEIAEDRIEIALLGQFSAGKSSLINAILGLPVNDREQTLLPTSMAAETATITRVSYADIPTATVTWLPSVSLTFLEPAPHHRFGYRVRVHELAAFAAWLAGGEVDLADCRFRSLEDDDASGRELLEGFLAMWPEPTSNARFVYRRHRSVDFEPHLPDGPIPAGVEVTRFRRDVPSTWPGQGKDVREIFNAVRQPMHALRVDRLNVGFPHELLRHAAFLDTPGTDAPIPHHRKVAHGIVEDRALPVVYCVFGGRPGAREDRDNLSFLKSSGVGGADLSRFFFVITRKGDVPQRNQEEVRRAVRGQLARLDLHPGKLYFTEVLYEHNDEFRMLVADLSRFVTASRSTLVEKWINDGRVLVQRARDRAQRNIDRAHSTAAERQRRIRDLEGEQAALAQIAAEFQTVHVPWAEGRLRVILADGPSQITQQIDDLSGREHFRGSGPEALEADLPAQINELDGRIRPAIVRLRDGLAAKVTSELAERLPGREIAAQVTAMPDALFTVAEVRTAIQGQVWRPFYRRGWGGKKKDAADNRRRIENAWKASHRTARREAQRGLGQTVAHLRRELGRIAAAIAAELADEHRPPPGDDGLIAARDVADQWLERFAVLLDDYRKHQTR